MSVCVRERERVRDAKRIKLLVCFRLFYPIAAAWCVRGLCTSNCCRIYVMGSACIHFVLYIEPELNNILFIGAVGAAVVRKEKVLYSALGTENR